MLGTEIEQRGSRVLPSKLTFDFNFEPLGEQRVYKLEEMVKKMICEKNPVYVSKLPLKVILIFVIIHINNINN